MSSGLLGKNIVITGAGGGIGRAAALIFAEAGARLTLTDVNSGAGNETLEAITEKGGEAVFVLGDLSVENDVNILINRAVEKFGPLDGAFNNAGIAQCGLPLHELSTEQWESAIRIDLTAVFWCLKYEIIAMLETGGGAIVNTASGLGMVATNMASEYVAAKHGVIGLTRSAATEYASLGIRTNAILPGFVETQMNAKVLGDPAFSTVIAAYKKRHSVGRFGQASEIGEAAKWLLSDAASFVNGAAMAVDGGFLAN